MIIIPATVKPDQTKPHQIFDFSRRRVNHSYNRLSLAFDFPVYKKQVREDLNVIKYQLRILIFHGCGRVGGFKLHLIYQLDTIIGLVRTIRCKCQYRIPHICDIIFQVAGICILQYFVNKVDTGLSTRMNLFIEITFYQCSKPFLALNRFKIYHFVFSFQW